MYTFTLLLYFGFYIYAKANKHCLVEDLNDGTQIRKEQVQRFLLSLFPEVDKAGSGCDGQPTEEIIVCWLKIVFYFIAELHIVLEQANHMWIKPFETLANFQFGIT